MSRSRTQILLYAVVAVALGLSLSILFWLRSRYASDRIEWLRDMQSFFTQDEVLKPPYDLNIRFGQIEALARKFEGSLFAHRVYVSKFVEGEGEHIVYPFYLQALTPNWRASVKGWTRLELTQDGKPYGALYVDENRATQNAVQWSIVGLGTLLVLTLGLLTARVFIQQSEIVGAYVALEEKERQLVRLERLALAGQLSANLLHDIKKPVANIGHNVADLEMALRDLAGGSSALRHIKEQTDLFFAMLRDVGFERFVRADDSGREYVNLNDILRRSCALVQYEADGIETVWDLDESSTLLILAPPYRLIQVFSNLILNAYQAMEDKGRLTLRTRLVGNRALTEVLDSGPGVSPQILARLFEPFESSKPEDQGTGLGLYISRNIVHELGGELRLANTGPGACFVVELPMAGGAAGA
jgi:signal transduction histidine kinase